MPLKSAGNKYQWLFHVLGIIMFLSFPILDLPHHFKESNPFVSPFVQRDIIGYILIILFFYLCYYYLVDKFFFTKKYIIFLLIILACAMLIVLIPELIISQRKIDNCVEFKKACIKNKQNFPVEKREYAFKLLFVLKLINHVGFKIIVGLLFALVLKIYIRLKKTQEEKVNAQVSFLRAQVNPHFLFNSLNSIYSLSITKSDQAPTAVATLSDMMRYVLSQNDEEQVPLEKELNYIKDYISMQQLRLTSQTNLQFNIIGKPNGLKITPMLLIPFIENAFKYGVNPNKESDIKIEINIHDGNLELFVFNQKVVDSTDKENGVGIVNVKSRLELIYPDQYKLIENVTEKDYTINLNLKL